jgi:hypothetical protein
MKNKRVPHRAPESAAVKARQSAAVATPNAVRPIILALRSAGVSFLKIGRALEAAGVGTPQGGRWQASAIHRLIESDPEEPETAVSLNSQNRGAEASPEVLGSQTVRQRATGGRHTISHAAFKARFSSHVTQALVSHGIDAPERLLLMSDAEIHEVPGLGKGALGEIKLYRDQFLPGAKR